MITWLLLPDSSFNPPLLCGHWGVEGPSTSLPTFGRFRLLRLLGTFKKNTSLITVSYCPRSLICYERPETNISPLKMDGWKMTFLLGNPIFRCENVSSGRVHHKLSGYSSISISVLVHCESWASWECASPSGKSQRRTCDSATVGWWYGSCRGFT